MALDRGGIVIIARSSARRRQRHVPSVARGVRTAWTAAPCPRSRARAGSRTWRATSSTDAWAVGHRFDPSDQDGHTLIEHHDGTSWAIAPSADGPADAAERPVGGRRARTDRRLGRRLRSRGEQPGRGRSWSTGTASSWTRVKSPNAGQPAGGELSGVVALAADDAWAVGRVRPRRTEPDADRALGRHGVDGRAEPEQGAVPNALSGVAAVAPDDIWAVGTWFTKAFDDRTLTLHWDGTAWHRVTSPNAGPGRGGERSRVGVRGRHRRRLGRGLRGLQTLTMHWDGTSWSIVAEPDARRESPIWPRVVAVATDDVWAAGGSVDRQVERRSNARRALGRHGVVGRARREQGPERQPPVGSPAATGRMLAVGDRFSGGGTRSASSRSPWSAAAR